MPRVGRGGRGEGHVPHNLAVDDLARCDSVGALGRILWLHQIGDALTAGLVSGVTLWPASLLRASVSVMAPLYWLHRLCIR